MSEEKIRRRGWVKNAAIIFLALMLVFTLFSNTIMNRSLPEVVAQPAQRSTITLRVRGQGSVSANETYDVTLKETREIQSVPVKIGQTVEIGDVLTLLSDRDSTEIQEAEKALEALKLEYEKAVVAASGITYEKQNLAIRRAQEDLDKLYLEKAKGEVSDEELQAGKDKVAALKDDVKSYSEQVAYYEYMAQQAQNDGKPAFGYLTMRDLAKTKLDAAQKDLTTAEEELADLQKRRDGYSTLDDDILTAQRSIEDMVVALNEQQIADGKTQALNAIEMREMQKKIEDATANLAKLRDNTSGSEVVSQVRGVIRQINYTAGKTVTPDDVLMQIDVTDRGYTVSFAVTNEQAAQVKVGDVGEVSNYYMWGAQIQAVLDAIRNDPSKPAGQGKVLTFAIFGEVNAGEQLTITVGQRSAEYDVVVPNSAVREDTNGTFVYQLVAKSSPLGNRYIATRVPVTVIAKDDMSTAIESSLSSGWDSDFVITTSSKPLEHGMQVRQVDNS